MIIHQKSSLSSFARQPGVLPAPFLFIVAAGVPPEAFHAFCWYLFKSVDYSTQIPNNSAL